MTKDPKTQPSIHEAQHGVRLSRHDEHSLEVKAWIDRGPEASETQLDVFLFIPRSFQVSRWAKQDLSQDFRSRVRLAMPSRPTHHDVLGHVLQVIERISRLGAGGVLSETMTEGYKEIGALVSELLKQRAGLHRRQLTMAHSLSLPVPQRAKELGRLLQEIRGTAESLLVLRRRLDTLSGLGDPVLPLLDEYLSNFYVKYLGKIRIAFDSVDPVARERADCASYREVCKVFDFSLSVLQREEAAYRTRFPQRVERAQTAEEQEHSVVRLSQLKKFFQSRMFLDVALHSPSHRFLETTAVAGTAIAGLCWALVQFWNRPDLVQTTNQGIFVIGFAVATYVLRDRIKDRAKASLHKRVQQWLPDLDQQLLATGGVIGNIREWFYLQRREDLPPAIARLRSVSAQNDLDKNLPEDILRLRKVIRVTSPSSPEGGWALQESTRICLDRYFKFMDDPVKELAVLGVSGELTRFRSRRVYHFYVAVQMSTGEQTPTQRLYRAVLAKTGLDRLEPVLA